MTVADDGFFSSLKNRRLSVIVPVFNEGEKILSNLSLLLSEIEPYFANYEVLVINDGSTDETNEALKQCRHDRIRTIFLEKNRGKGHAVRTGFMHAKGDYVLFIDGGMELHPREIRVFLALLLLYDADVVIGSKRHPQSQLDYPLLRRILSSCYQLLIKALFDLDVTDTQVGLKLFTKRVVDAIKADLSIDGYGFDLEILALAKHAGHARMLEAPIRLDYFSKNSRGFLHEFLHIVPITFTILLDTWRVYRRVRTLDKVANRHVAI